MGAIAEAFVAYAQPLIDETDGSEEQMRNAFAVSQFCYNLALIPEEIREVTIGELKISLKMGDEEFSEFRRSVITPMIQRQHTMFAKTHRHGSADVANSDPRRRTRLTVVTTAKENPRTDRYEACSCNSGLKYKFCCGKK